VGRGSAKGGVHRRKKKISGRKKKPLKGFSTTNSVGGRSQKEARHGKNNRTESREILRGKRLYLGLVGQIDALRMVELEGKGVSGEDELAPRKGRK